MGHTTAVALVAFASLAAACATPTGSDRIVDLSHTFDSQTIYWPTEEGFVLEHGTAGMTDQGYYYAAHRFRGAEHGGTHIDAPIHFAEGHWTLDEIPVERLVGPAVKIDVSDRCARDPDYRVVVSDFERWEDEYGEIPGGSIVLLQTGFSVHWPDREKYLGTDERGAQAVAKLHFPGLHPDAATWLVEQRNIHAVGLDTASIDYGQSRLFRSHRILFEADIPAFENLTSLDELPPKGFELYALPMNIGGGSGAPLRAVAVIRPGR